MSFGEQLRDAGYAAVDHARDATGAWHLTRSDQMSWEAGEHAGWLARTGKFEHTPDRLIGQQRENIWKGIGIHPEGMIWDAIQNQWMHSDWHRFNLIDQELSHMGIGIHIQIIEQRNLYCAVLVYRASGG